MAPSGFNEMIGLPSVTNKESIAAWFKLACSKMCIRDSSNRKPTDIILVGSASRYGDYFTGSTGSTLWLDDLELIYE